MPQKKSVTDVSAGEFELRKLSMYIEEPLESAEVESRALIAAKSLVD